MAGPVSLRRLALAASLLLALALGPAEATPLPTAPPPDHEKPASWAGHWKGLSGMGEGFLVWESNRSGSWRIWTRRLDGGGLRMLSRDEAGRDHIAPHISPDGRHVVYLSTPAPHHDFRRLADDAPAELRLVNLAEGRERALGPAHSYWQNRAAVWVDAERFIYIDAERRTVERNLRTGEDVVLARSDRKFGVLVNATRTHATTGRPSFSLYHEEEGSVAERRKLNGCQPYFAHDGRYGFWVGGSGGPFRALDLATRRTHVILDKKSSFLPQGHGYVYYPMVSRDGRLLAFGASRNEHGHFRADFDIFVAPLDPETLEVVGAAARYSFDPGQDRFPDVFASGSELGDHEGEAPYRVRFATPPGAGGAGPWSFSFGDGATGASATHVFATPGTYHVTARRGGERLTGSVVVHPGSPPNAEGVAVPPGRKRLVVTFDEPIDARKASARLASGARIVSLVPAREGRELELRLERPLEGDDTLHLAGVVDRSDPPRAMAPAELAVPVGVWPWDDEGLLFLWETDREENLVPDPADGMLRASSLEPRDRARLDAHGAMELSGGSFRTRLPKRTRDALAEAGALTVELTVDGKRRQRGRAHLVAIGPPGGEPVFALTEYRQQLQVQVRTREGTRKLPLTRLHKGRKPQHLMVALQGGRLLAWRDGEPVAQGSVVFEPSLWPEELLLSVGADLRGGSDWRGTAEGVALYARGFADHGARVHANAYLDRVRERDPVKSLKLKARLASVSEVPTLEQIEPYREALVVHEYRVLKGKLKGATVRVAHWAILDGKPQAIGSARVGQKRQLVIEPLAAHPHVEGKYLSDTLSPDLETPLYLDVAS